jgi:PAS domain S-box-containing protein
MIDLEGDPGLWSESLHGFCRAALAGVPGGTVVVFDAELRVRFAEGESLSLAGLGSMVGRRLPDVLPAASWELLRAPYEAALGGRTSTCDFTAGAMLLSIHVSPFALVELGRAGLAVSREVGEQRRVESAVVVGEGAVWASEELFRAAFEHAPLGISVIGLDGRRLRVNDACCRIAGYSREEMVGSDLGDFTHPEDVARDQQFLAAAVAGEGDHLEREKRYLHKDGSVLWVQAQSEMVRDGLGNPLFVVAHIQDISDRRVAREQRRGSDRTLRAVIDHSPAVICVKNRNLRFELVNREFEEWCDLPSEQILGHTAEELAVGPIAESGRAMDEQVLESGEASQKEEMLVRGDQQRAFLTLRFPLFDDDLAVQSVCSMSTDITERRDEERTRQERLQCSVEIHAALAQDRFVLHGQPIMNLVSMKVEQAELLLRMRDADGSDKLLAPGAFLPAAERFDQIGLIDEWVLDRAVELAAAGHRVEVNLSAKTISDPRQIDRIEQVVIQSGAAPQNLIFEITETAAAENLEAARAFAVRLRQLGCAFALDDFGIGHGTFTYLQHLPVDYLKIDLAFVRELLRGDSNRDVVLAIIGVAEQFGIKTIAEGIEDQATLDELRRLGVDYAQGYWIGRPVALDQLWKPTDDQEA